MKLELKHLAPYLPHGLKVVFESKGGRVLEILGLRKSNNSIFFSTENETLYINTFKPILFPLSEYYSEENRYGGYISFRDFKYEVINKRISLKVYEDLLKNKFDVFGLIDEGLAIPATEDFNPYK